MVIIFWYISFLDITIFSFFLWINGCFEVYYYFLFILTVLY